MRKFYLAHNFGNRKMIRKWELRIEKKYNLILENPFYDSDRSDIKIFDKMKDGSKEQAECFRIRNTKEQVDLIVDGDLRLIGKSDGLVAYLETSKKFSRMIGTPMEIFYAARILKIPVYVITKRFAYHPWVKKFATEIFKNRTEFEKFVKYEFGLKKEVGYVRIPICL